MYLVNGHDGTGPRRAWRGGTAAESGPLPVRRRSAGRVRCPVGLGPEASSVRRNTRCIPVRRLRQAPWPGERAQIGLGWHPSSAARTGVRQESCKREELDFKSRPRSPPHLQENEHQKPLICKAAESCMPPTLRTITHPTVDKARPRAQEFAHCSEGGRSTQGSAELTAPALPMRSDSANERDGRDVRHQHEAGANRSVRPERTTVQ